MPETANTIGQHNSQMYMGPPGYLTFPSFVRTYAPYLIECLDEPGSGIEAFEPWLSNTEANAGLPATYGPDGVRMFHVGFIGWAMSHSAVDDALSTQGCVVRGG